MNLNYTILAGRLTRDPEYKKLDNGTDLTAFGMATSSTRKDKEGNKVEDTEYHNIVVFGNQANACAEFLKKGSLVLVAGKLKTRSWESDGHKNYRTEIIADRVQFGPRPTPQADTSEAASTSNGSTKVNLREDRTPDYPEEEIDAAGIPF